MKYLVTGGAGFIGSHLVDALVARGDDVLVLDDLSTGSRENLQHVPDDQVELIVGSVLDRALVDDCMRRVDACFHLAAAVGVRLLVEQTLESVRSNALGADNVITLAAQHDRRVLFTSSSEVYGQGDGMPMREGAHRPLAYRMHARRAYAASKLFAEALAESCAHEFDSETIVARLFNTVGPRQTGRYGMVLPRFVDQALAGSELTIYGDGRQSRCFLHVSDTVTALVGLMDTDAATAGVYNVGSSEVTRVVDLANLVIERLGSTTSRTRFVPFEIAYEPGFEDVERRTPDTTALRRVIDWAPSHSLSEAIDDLIAERRGQAAKAPASAPPGAVSG
jgi:UDP-glucose 4-epimerase